MYFGGWLILSENSISLDSPSRLCISAIRFFLLNGIPANEQTQRAYLCIAYEYKLVCAFNLFMLLNGCEGSQG